MAKTKVQKNSTTDPTPASDVREIPAGDFSTRADLENQVRDIAGLTTEVKPKMVIVGTDIELKKLQLRHGAIFWGIVCRQPDGEIKARKPAPAEKVPRGKRTSYGIESRENLKKVK